MINQGPVYHAAVVSFSDSKTGSQSGVIIRRSSCDFLFGTATACTLASRFIISLITFTAINKKIDRFLTKRMLDGERQINKNCRNVKKKRGRTRLERFVEDGSSRVWSPRVKDQVLSTDKDFHFGTTCY